MASSATATSVSQLSCFSAIDRKRQLRMLSNLAFSDARFKSSVAVSLGGHGPKTSASRNQSVLSYKGDPLLSQTDGTMESYTSTEDASAGNTGTSEPETELGIPERKRAAKIHDFCLGIPFGGLVFTGGLLGFIFSRNPMSLSHGVLCGGAILALSTLSLKIWRKGKSSLPFILGQIVFSGAIFWKNFQTYSVTKKLFPTGFYILVSAVMLCFYSYVILAGGNPPPKKKSSAYAS